MPFANEQLPFPRGQYAVLTAPDGDLIEGKEFLHEDRNFGSTGHPYRSRRMVRVRVVRNASGVALPPKRLVVLGRDAAYNLTGATATAGAAGTTEVVGIARTSGLGGLGAKAFPVDEFLPAAGVPNGALFYIVVEGPAMCIGSLANYTTAIAVGDVLHSALTAATSAVTNGITNGGRIGEVLSLNNTDVTAHQVLNRLGRALSANATDTTNGNILVDVGA